MSQDLEPSFDGTRFARRSEVLDLVLDHVPQGIVVVGQNYRVLAFNRPFDDLFSLPPGTFRVGGDFREVILAWVRATGQNEEMRARALARLDMREMFEVQLPQTVNGECRWVKLTHNPLPDGGFVRTFTDITEQKRLEEKLFELSRTDSLTELLNRRSFLDALAAEVERSHRYGRPLTLMSIDIDHFKQINDHYGHPVGDRVLRAFARALASSMRNNDLIGRLGGEEFAVLLLDSPLELGAEAAERVLAMARGLRVGESAAGPPVKFTVSIGLAEGNGTVTVEQLISRADKALYQAKGDGRDCCRRSRQAASGR
jgi:diguanylate cyclase (GGDEF)-like protein/PAS domain S-box-containing protein